MIIAYHVINGQINIQNLPILPNSASVPQPQERWHCNSNLVFGEQKVNAGEIMAEIGWGHNLLLFLDPRFFIGHVPVELPHATRFFKSSLSFVGQQQQLFVSRRQMEHAIWNHLRAAWLVTCNGIMTMCWEFRGVNGNGISRQDFISEKNNARNLSKCDAISV